MTNMNVDRVIGWPFPPVVQSYTRRDSPFYALSLGLGANPVDDASGKGRGVKVLDHGHAQFAD
ncbi:MAG: hypothetical protein ABI574_12325 [Burkholderiales bacterium]